MTQTIKELTGEFFTALAATVKDHAPETYTSIDASSLLVENNSAMPGQWEDYLDIKFSADDDSVRIGQSSYELVTTNVGDKKLSGNFGSAVEFFETLAQDVVEFTGAKFSGADVTRRMPSLGRANG